VGGGAWEKSRAKDQLDVAEAAFAKKDYRIAFKAARRVVKRWPLSDYAPRAQYLIGRVYEAQNKDERAFKAYQALLEKYPKMDNYQEVLHRQFDICSRFLGGQWFKLWGYIPFFPSMDKTANMLEKLVKNGPYSDVAPQAQMSIGAAREKQKDFPKAVKAYERAADVYHDDKAVAADAQFKAGLAYNRQAKRAEYDQSVAGKAISTFSDFNSLYPEDQRVPQAQEYIKSLRTEQARGSYEIARYYEKKGRWNGALIYYNDVITKDESSQYAADARHRIERLKSRVQNTK